MAVLIRGVKHESDQVVRSEKRNSPPKSMAHLKMVLTEEMIKKDHEEKKAREAEALE